MVSMKTINSDYIYEKQQKAKRNRKIRKYKQFIFLVTTLTVVIGLLTILLFSNLAQVEHYRISGNKLLANDYIYHYLNLSTTDNYFFRFNSSIQSKLKKHPLVESVVVKHSPYRIISIELKEKDILAYLENAEPYLVTLDGEQILLEDFGKDAKQYLPKISGFTTEELKSIAPYFKEIDSEVFSEISEIIKFPFSFDPLNMQIILRDGNNVFASKEALYLLDEIHGIVSNIREQPSCIYFDEVTSTAFTSSCPWSKEILIDPLPTNTEQQ